MKIISNRFGLSILVGLAALGALAVPSNAKAQIMDFWHYSTSTIGNDFNTGDIVSGAYGNRAVPITSQTNVEIRQGNTPGSLELWTFSSFSGNFLPMGANLNTQFFDILENNGINSSGSISLQEVTVSTHYGDIAYIFDTTLHINVNAWASIYRRPNDILTGIFRSHSSAVGAIPLNSSVEVVTYPTDHPSFVPDWQIYVSTNWAVTASFQQLPTPGTASLLGLGGLVAFRRRRRAQ